MWSTAFADAAVTIERIMAQDQQVAVEFTGRGTHTGTLSTVAGDIPATGRSVTLQFVDLIEFDDGKVKTQHSYVDTGSLMAQLGISAPQSAGTQ
jgi:predicted ester cyclase